MELTSPLTSLTSISTPHSYHTARGSPFNAADDTSPSSSIEEPPPPPVDPGYRDAVQLPHELKSHCQIHMEEQLYTAAIHILSGLLSDGNIVQRPLQLKHQKPKPARIPPPSQIALLATLIIHPSFTSRAPEISNIHAASYALSYLRGLLSTVGPVNANLRAAFEFIKPGIRLNGRGGDNVGSASGNTSNDDDSDSLSGAFACSQLLFRRAPDFWGLLGWAFRCAAEYPQRWRHWRVWLEYMVSVLEADFDERLSRDDKQEKVGEEGSARAYPMLAGSLMVGYLEGLRRERRNGLKEVMRAMFAFSDGETVASDRVLYREVFEKETAIAKPGEKTKRKRVEEAVVDLENDQFGDYLDGDDFSSDFSSPDRPTTTTPHPKRRGRKPKPPPTPTFTLTDPIYETVPFRLRLFRLLSNVSYYLPSTFTPVSDLYENFTSHVRNLPLPIYRLFIESHQSYLPEDIQVSFLRSVIEDLLPPNCPDPATIDPENSGSGLGEHGVTVLMMRECFLPFAAHRVTAEDNAKLSLALESLMGFVYAQIDVEYDDGLRRAVERGIRARDQKVGSGGGRRRGPGKGEKEGETEAREILARSGRGLRRLVDVVATAGR
ncbi:hypothetical protein VTI74DRAFT_7156 [Chaetomium olivicolor]